MRLLTSPDNPNEVLSYHWNRDELVNQMRPFFFTAPSEISEIEKHYCAYYRIDLENNLKGVEHRLGYFEAAGYRIAMHVYRPAKVRGTVFVFHGYFDHAGLYGHLIRELLQQKLAVVIYDLPGHGLSSGDPVAIQNFQTYQEVMEACIELCRGQVPEPWYTVGQSTGAAVLLDNLLTQRYSDETSPFKQWVLLAPLVRPAGWWPGLVLHTFVSPFLRTWKRAFTENSNDSSFIRFVRKHDPLQSQVLSVEWVSALRAWVKRIESMPPVKAPLTIVQGRQDGTVDWRHNLRVLRRKFPGVDVYYLAQGRHHLVNESEDLREQIFTIIRTKFSQDGKSKSGNSAPHGRARKTKKTVGG